MTDAETIVQLRRELEAMKAENEQLEEAATLHGEQRDRLAVKITDNEAELDEARKSIEQWKYEATKWEGLHDLIADELIFEQTRDSIGPTEELPDTVRRIIKERDYLQSQLDACIKSHQRMNADNERLERELENVQINRDQIAKHLNEYVAENDAQRQTIERLVEALQKIKSDPYGCVYCDSGKLRNPQKQHQEQCGFADINAALEAAAPFRKAGDAQ